MTPYNNEHTSSIYVTTGLPLCDTWLCAWCTATLLPDDAVWIPNWRPRPYMDALEKVLVHRD